MRIRGEAFDIHIEGEDELSVRSHEVTFEGANTSLQVHLRVDPEAFARTYNAAQAATAVVLAAAGNSPFFLGQRLWHETRVALFRQSVDDRGDAREDDWRPARVSFGHGWVRQGAQELFEEARQLHEPVLPVLGPEDPLGGGQGRGRARRWPSCACITAPCGAGIGPFTIPATAGTCASRCGRCRQGPSCATRSPTPPSSWGSRSASLRAWPSTSPG